MSEKLAAFITLYNEKAASDLDKAKDSVQKAEERLAESEELWEKVRTEADNLGIVDKFLSAFPEPGGAVNVTIGGVGANPDYTSLFEYGDPLAGLVKDLTKLKNAKQRLENSNSNLSQAESLLGIEPEDYLNKLGSAIFSEMAGASSLGAEPAGGLLSSIFESYEDYEETVGYELDSIEGPSGVKTSEQTYEALKERYESGSLTKKSEGAKAAAEQAIMEAEGESSPINEIEEGTERLNEAQPASPINVLETPAESESVVSEVTGTSPELNQPLVSDQLDLIANINIESETPLNAEQKEVESETPLNAEQEEVESEPAAVSSTTNMDFSKMTSEEIRNSFLTGDVFGGIRNEFSNIFRKEATVASPVNEPVSEEILESEQPTPVSSFINSDFSKMTAEEIRNSFQTGDVFGGIKNTFSNIFGGRKSPEAEEASSETTERKGFLSNIFARGREKKAEETVERGATTMNAPIISNTSAPVAQETPDVNIATNQQVEARAQAEPASNQTSNVSNVSNDNSDQSTSENISSSRSSMMQAGSDNSDIVNRLRRLERLLSGPLEVKIVES